jgi:uncharacterized protein (DUF486 family)
LQGSFPPYGPGLAGTLTPRDGTRAVVTLCVFAVFAVAYMKERLHLNHLWAGLCLVGAVFFTFRR